MTVKPFYGRRPSITVTQLQQYVCICWLYPTNCSCYPTSFFSFAFLLWCPDVQSILYESLYADFCPLHEICFSVLQNRI